MTATTLRHILAKWDGWTPNNQDPDDWEAEQLITVAGHLFLERSRNRGGRQVIETLQDLAGIPWLASDEFDSAVRVLQELPTPPRASGSDYDQFVQSCVQFSAKGVPGTPSPSYSAFMDWHRTRVLEQQVEALHTLHHPLGVIAGQLDRLQFDGQLDRLIEALQGEEGITSALNAFILEFGR